MCFFGSSQPAAPPKPEFDDSPPVVTGMQTGIENPKNTTRATEELKIKRQKKEGTYVDPNLSAVEEKLTRRGDRAKAQSMAKARITKKKSFSNKVSGK